MYEHFNLDIDMRQMQQNMQNYLQQHWKLFAVEGVFFIILGTAAIIVPHLFTVGITLFLGWLLLIGGIIQLVRVVTIMDMPGFSLWLFTGLLQVVIGYFLVSEPSEGIMTLTMLLTVLFAIEGIVKTYLAFMMRPLARWSRMLLSGITSLLLAIVICASWPGSAAWILGLLLGINMIFLGGSLLNISLHHKNTT
ncbi:MAG: HdeD family acid-resistance protein [Methylovulum sp.]|nr:HdeD family acid-resistance protein [Methylovulum sp.]